MGGIFIKSFDQIIPKALEKNIRIRVLASDKGRLPAHVRKAVEEIESKTSHCSRMNLNLCISYGSRQEIANACKLVAADVAAGKLSVEDVDENAVNERLLTSEFGDPELLLRTSGELRISNFLLYQIAYTEIMILEKNWPEVRESDLHDIIRSYNMRKRRFGK